MASVLLASEFNTGPLSEALSLLPQRMDSKPARLMVICICLQESELKWRKQHRLSPGMPHGPARGLAQFERNGGVAGVLEDRATADLAKLVCEHRGIPPERAIVWEALEHDDVLAAAFARLLLWTDPQPLPRVGDEAGAFALYLRTWRPGAYTRGNEAQRGKLRTKWQGNYRAAVEAVTQPAATAQPGPSGE